MKTTVSQLNVGERFIIPTLRQTMRNLIVERLSDCSTVVHGQEREGIDQPWKAFTRPISNNVQVEPDNSPVVDDVTVETVDGQTKVVHKRKKSVNLVIPDGPFTLKQAATASNATPVTVFKLMQAKIDAKELFFIGNKSGGKGKPTRYFSTNENDVVPVGEKTVEKTFIVPDGVFTIKQLATASNVNPVVASNFVKAQVETKELFFLGRQSMGKGKPTQFFSKNENDVIPDAPVKAEKPVVEKVASVGRKGKKPVEVNLVIPDGEFSRNELAMASNCTPAIAYLRIQTLIAEGKIVEYGKRKNVAGKGKPTTLYKKVD